jgi:hypothetical protein
MVLFGIANALTIIGNMRPVSSWYHHNRVLTLLWLSRIITILILAIDRKTSMLSVNRRLSLLNVYRANVFGPKDLSPLIGTE